jgi:hypothetical protein
MALNQNTKVFRAGLRRLENIAHNMDEQYPSDPPLGSLVTFAFRHEFYFVNNLKQRTKRAHVSPQAASREGLGLMMNGFIEVADEVLFEHKGNQDLLNKFNMWVKQVGPLSDLRSSTGRDIWMNLSGYNENHDVDVSAIAHYLIANNCLPQQCHDKDQENFTDYLIRYSPVFFDDIFNPLKSVVPLAWWKKSLESSRFFDPDPSMWNSNLHRLDKREAPRAQKILDHYFVLTLQNEVEQVSTAAQQNRKAKI